jgi:hypothetical protein
MVHDIEWKSPNGSPSPSSGRFSVEDTVSHLDGVRAAIYGKALGMAREASLALSHHHRTGAAHVTVSRHPHAGARTPDWYVYLRDADPGGEGKAGLNKADRSAMSIEFGWTQTHVFGKRLAEPIHHDGLHILGWVFERAVSRYHHKAD